jgi:hypothetical protein
LPIGLQLDAQTESISASSRTSREPIRERVSSTFFNWRMERVRGPIKLHREKTGEVISLREQFDQDNRGLSWPDYIQAYLAGGIPKERVFEPDKSDPNLKSATRMQRHLETSGRFQPDTETASFWHDREVVLRVRQDVSEPDYQATLAAVEEFKQRLQDSIDAQAARIAKLREPYAYQCLNLQEYTYHANHSGCSVKCGRVAVETEPRRKNGRVCWLWLERYDIFLISTGHPEFLATAELVQHWKERLREEFKREAKARGEKTRFWEEPEGIRVQRAYREKLLVASDYSEDQQDDAAAFFSDDEAVDGDGNPVHDKFGTRWIVNDAVRFPNYADAVEPFRKFYNPDSTPRTPAYVAEITASSKFERDAQTYARQVEIAPSALPERERKAMERRRTDMGSINAGRCPTGTCPKDRCAAPGLSPREREVTHAANLMKQEKARRIRPGTSYFVVVLSGRPEFKFLDIPDVRGLPAEEQESLANVAVDVVRHETKKNAIKEARRNGNRPSNRTVHEIEHRIDDAFDAGHLYLCVRVSESSD